MARNLIVAVALLAALTACSGDGAVSPQSAEVEGGRPEVMFQIPSCNADISWEIEESDTEVRVAFDVRNDTDNDCLDGARVPLDEPIGRGSSMTPRASASWRSSTLRSDQPRRRCR